MGKSKKSSGLKGMNPGMAKMDVWRSSDLPAVLNHILPQGLTTCDKITAQHLHFVLVYEAPVKGNATGKTLNHGLRRRRRSLTRKLLYHLRSWGYSQ